MAKLNGLDQLIPFLKPVNDCTLLKVKQKMVGRALDSLNVEIHK